MIQVLLVGKDWKARALLRAQLVEEGLEVEAHDTVASAFESLGESELLPALVLADLTASDDPPAELDQLASWTNQIPTWIIASRNLIVEKVLKGRGFEVILFRPVDLGELVEQIKQRLERSS